MNDRPVGIEYLLAKIRALQGSIEILRDYTIKNRNLLLAMYSMMKNYEEEFVDFEDDTELP